MTHYDEIIQEITNYVVDFDASKHKKAMETARYCLMDSLGCGILALQYPACTKLLGPIVPGAILKNGVRVPGTSYVLDPVQAAFNIGTMIRWLDFNDTWLAAEWGHPSDNLGAILAVTEYLSSQGQPIEMKKILEAMIKAHEIQGVLALENSFNRVGLDHVLLVRIASTAVATWLLGGSKDEIANAVSNAFLDGGALRAYRHAPNTGSRKSWAAGDATSRSVRLALMSLKGEMGYATALTAKGWGFEDVLFKGKTIKLAQPLGTYVMEQVLFKLSYPAEFHAQTAVEAAVILHPEVKGKMDQIERIVIETQEPAVRIIDKKGPLNNPADRDHCLQYMIAVGLIKGNLTAQDYENAVAKSPEIDRIRDKMIVQENKQYSVDYYDPKKRAIPNAIQVFFKDGTQTENIEVYYPIGHKRRRDEGIPILLEKFKKNMLMHYGECHFERILACFSDQQQFEQVSISSFSELFLL